jgi:hypothetical protein
MSQFDVTLHLLIGLVDGVRARPSHGSVHEQINAYLGRRVDEVELSQTLIDLEASRLVAVDREDQSGEMQSVAVLPPLDAATLMSLASVDRARHAHAVLLSPNASFVNKSNAMVTARAGQMALQIAIPHLTSEQIMTLVGDMESAGRLQQVRNVWRLAPLSVEALDRPRVHQAVARIQQEAHAKQAAAETSALALAVFGL